MCTRLKVKGTYITPGMVMQYQILSSIRSGRFGLDAGRMPNVREERLKTYWAPLFGNRAVIEAEVFYEKGCTFGIKNTITRIPCIFDVNGDVGIITTDATGPVKAVHHRMPCIIVDIDAWLKHGYILHMEGIIQSKLA